MICTPAEGGMLRHLARAEALPQVLSRAAPTGTSTAVLVSAILSSALLAALITALINIWLARRKSREEDRARARDAFAAAYATYASYCEFAYAIRRRDPTHPEAERVRLSEALRDIQARLSNHLAWTALESPAVGEVYRNLIDQARHVAGGAMRDAWNSDPARTDQQVNIPGDLVDLSGLRPLEAEYLEAVKSHLHKLTPWWAR
jgi:hypothetical protein